MGQDYARGIPMGNNAMPAGYQTPPAIKAIATTASENATVSSVITLSANTTAIEIGTSGAQAVMRWVFVGDGTGPATSVIATAGSANFDHTIPSNGFRRFVVPIEVNNPQGYGSMVGANIQNGLFRRLAYKTAGIASVLVTEYGSSNTY